jgi:hypothetical protein
MEHILVLYEAGMCSFGPANSGIWNWGDEIVVGFTTGPYDANRGKPPLTDQTKPALRRQARSLDGGRTWALEELPDGVQPPPALKVKDRDRFSNLLPLPDEGINFCHPDFAMQYVSPVFHLSYDRCRTWEGPYGFPDFGLEHLTSRTSYWVNGSQDCHLFLSGRSSSFTVLSALSDRAFCARTTDGGRTFDFLGWMVPEDPAPRSVMPSVVRLSDTKLVATLRRRRDGDRDGALLRICWIDAYESLDNGRTWRFLSKVADTDIDHLQNGNPPSMVQLADGRLVVVYGFRSPPFSMRARVSNDEGKTWEDELVLRDDGINFDLGYPRSVVRPDGKIVSVYWFSTQERPEGHIVATIWHPDEFSGGING